MELEKLVATFKLKETVHFAATRRHIRNFILESAEGKELDDLVTELLS